MPEHQPAAVGRRVVKAMFVIIFFGLFWKLGGFLMSVLVTGFYGENSAIWDVYNGVYSILIFTVFYSTLLKVVVPAFMPLFAEERERGGEEQAWRFASTIINLLIPAAVIVSIATWYFAPRIVAVLLHGFDPERQRLAASLLRMVAPGIAVLGFALLALAILNSYKVFGYPPAADAAQKLCWAVVLFVLIRFVAMDPRTALERPIGIGFLVGSVAQLAILLIGMRTKARPYRPSLPALSRTRLARELAVTLLAAGLSVVWIWLIGRWRQNTTDAGARARIALLFTGLLAIWLAYAAQLWWRARSRKGIMARFAGLAAPLLIGVVFARYRDVMTALFQSYTLTGVFGLLEFAKKVGNLPIILVAYSLSIAMFPFLCDLAVRKDVETFGRLLGRALRMIALFFVPLTVGVIVLREPTMRLVFDRGDWSEMHIRYGGLALAFFSAGLFFYAIENILMQSYFSLQRVWVPTLLGIAAALFHAGLLYLLIQAVGWDYPFEVFVIVALSFPVSRGLKNLALLVLIRTRLRMLPLRETALFVAKLAVISVTVGAAAWLAHRPASRLLPTRRFKAEKLMLDTFNTEPRGWFSHNAESLAVVSGDVPGFNGRSLRVKYRRTLRRPVSVIRDLTRLRLADPQRLRVRLASSTPTTLEVRVELPSKGVMKVPVPMRTPNEPMTVELPLQLAGAAQAARITIADIGAQAGQAVPGPATLWIDDLALTDGAAECVIDTFDPAEQPEWAAHGECAFGLDEVETETRKRKTFKLDLNVTGPVNVTHPLRGSELSGMQFFSLKAKATRDYHLEVALADAQGKLAKASVTVAKSRELKRYQIPVADFARDSGMGAGLAKLVAVTFREAPAPREGLEGTLSIDSVTFQEQRPEIALRVRGPVNVTRSLQNHYLGGLQNFSFKAMATRNYHLQVILADARHHTAKATVAVKKSNKRSTYQIPLADFRTENGAAADLSKAAEVTFREVPPLGSSPEDTLWLDNIAFQSPPAGPCVLIFWLGYELVKLVHFGVPVFVGLIVFVLLCFALRVEEAHIILNWVKEKGWRRRKERPQAQPTETPQA